MANISQDRVLLDVNSKPKTISDFKEGLCKINEVSGLLPGNVAVINELNEMRAKGKYDLNSLEERRSYSRFLKGTFGIDANESNVKDLNDYVSFVIDTDVMASPWALSTFQITPLRKDELPLIKFPRTRNLQRFAVNSAALDGTMTRNQWRETQDVLQMEMDMIGTELIEYSVANLQTGDINAGQALETEVMYDLEMKIDSLAKAQIDANAVASGLRDALSLHPNIVAANIPDTNYLDLSGVDAGVLTLDKLKQIISHVSKFGYAGAADEKFEISSIQISPQNLQDPWDFVSLVTGWDNSDANQDLPKNTIPSSMRDDIFNGGMITRAFGQTFSWMPNVQLAKGKLYVSTTKPLGWMFTKPEFDQFYWWDARTDSKYAVNNNGEMMAKKALKFYVPEAWRQRILVVDL